MKYWENYHLAHNLRDALNALTTASGPSRVIAGGTDLLLDMQTGRQPFVHTLVDVTNIPELNEISEYGEKLFIGAAISHNQIILSPKVKEHALAVVEACSLIGGPQVRNVATLGGNVAHALPAGDGTIALLALNAEVELANIHGRRRLSLEKVFCGPGESILNPREDIIIGFYLPLSSPKEASAFRRIMRPQGVAIAILNIGVWVRRYDNYIVDIRIAVGPSGPVPRRIQEAEKFLQGQVFSERKIEQAVELLIDQSKFRTSRHRATSEYRQKMAKVILRDALSIAWDRASYEPSSSIDLS